MATLHYFRAVVSKAKAMQQIASSTRDHDIFSQTINFSDLFSSGYIFKCIKTANSTRKQTTYGYISIKYIMI
jgi:hypothetical protein